MSPKVIPLTFPTSRGRKLALVTFDEVMKTKEVKKWSADNGYSDGQAEDIFSVGYNCNHEEVHRKLPIVALRCSVEIGAVKQVLYLSMVANTQAFFAFCDDSNEKVEWAPGCHFVLCCNEIALPPVDA